MTDPVTDIERWFRRRGVPHFIEGYSAARDVFTRTLPVLSLIFLVEVLGALAGDWPWWANALALVGGFAILLGTWALVNLARGRPAWSRPRRVGGVELAVFVLAPALLPLVFGGQVVAALLTALANLAILAVVYLVTSYAIFPMGRWAAGRIVRQLGSTVGLFARALPLLLLFVTFLFINAEVWQVAAQLEGAFFVATLLLFVAFGVVFVVARLRQEIGALAAFPSWEVVQSLVEATPARDLAGPPPPPEELGDLTVRQWANAGLVVLFSQLLQVTVVAVLVGAFFVALGLTAVAPPVVESWTGTPPQVLVAVSLFGREVPLTEELLRVASLLAAFSGLYFTVVGVTDPTYREDFFEDAVADLRQAFAVRVVYRAALLGRPR